jgi:hypothetical protein
MELLIVPIGTIVALLILALSIVFMMIAFRIFQMGQSEYDALKCLTGNWRNALHGGIMPSRVNAAEGVSTGGYVLSKDGEFRSQHKITDREIERILKIDRPMRG